MTNIKQLPHHQENWNGYSMDEIMYQKAFLVARMEVSKARLVASAEEVRNELPGGNKHSVWHKLLSGFSYVDYAVLAFKFGSRVVRLMRAVRR